MTTIRNRSTGEVIVEGDCPLKELVEKNKSNLSGSDLSGSDLRGSDLRGSDLRWSNLSWSNLRGSDLRWSNLRGSDLRGSDLRGSEIEFFQFPSIRLLSSMPLSRLSDVLILELMRRDAYGHPNPELFNVWANGGRCPYQNEERMWNFQEDRNLWQPGDPTMTDRDLVIAICKERGWKIKA